MTYWLIMFEIPTPKENLGPVKERIRREMYEQLCEIELPEVESSRGLFVFLTKRVFSMETENVAFIVADVKKMYR